MKITLKSTGKRASTTLRIEIEQPRKNLSPSSPWAEIQTLLGEHSLAPWMSEKLLWWNLLEICSLGCQEKLFTNRCLTRKTLTKQPRVESAGGSCWVLLTAVHCRSLHWKNHPCCNSWALGKLHVCASQEPGTVKATCAGL